MGSTHTELFVKNLGMVERHCFFIHSTHVEALNLFIRKLVPRKADTDRPVLFVHGATLASYLWDINLAGHSWMEHFALKGRTAHAVDIRGYGGSSKPLPMEEDPKAAQPVARASEAIQDINDAVEYLLKTTGYNRVDLVGGSWGSITSGMYAAGPGRDKVHRLILYAPIFTTPNQEWLDMLADPEEPMRLNSNLGSYRWVTEQDIRTRWDKEIPITDKEDWRSEDCFQAIIREALYWDDKSKSQSPPAFRVPNGTLVDLFEVFSSRPLYEPENIKAPTLLIRGADDPTATDPDARALFDRLGSHIKRYVVVGHGSHFFVAEKNRWQLFSESWCFLSQP